ncbi:MAG TPA: hypothetical protein VF331_02615 [Polyangiales bacterium]
MNLRPTLQTFVVVGCLCAAALPALAGATRSFVLDSASVLGEGKLEGTAVESDGSLVRSVGTRRIDLPGIPSARALLVMPDGTAYVGTGNDGKIFVVKDGAAKLFAETKQLMVSALASDGAGTLYAGTLSKGKIFAVDNAGKLREFASPKGAEHIWALNYDPKQKLLFAATGPEGKVFAIDAAGKADVYYDSEASHVMALARDLDGTLYAGTSDQALVLRLRGPGRADVVYDCDGNEVTALDVRNGELAVAANLFAKAPASKPVTTTPAADTTSPQASATPPVTNPVADRPQAGKGQLYRIHRDGSAERLFTADEGTITSVEWGDADVIYAGTGKDGHIHRVRPDHTHALWVDVDERQVLATKLSGKHPMFVTADAAAIYEVLEGPAAKPMWTSKVLDAQVPARFGQLNWRGQGKASLQTRSGNTEKPDTSWSDWSSAIATPGPIHSPAARFLQIRATLDTAAPSVLYAIEAFYLPFNQAPVVLEVSIEPPKPKVDKQSRTQPSGSVYKVKWKTENPDGDNLRLRLYYQQEQSTQWRPMVRESDVITGAEMSWETDGVPDAYYRVRVEASDELDNPESTARKGSALSEPFLVDNRPPHVDALKVQGGAITGVARDALGPIVKLEYTVDGLEWKLFLPSDDLFDTAEERFALPLALLPKGDHVVVIRASDARGNVGAGEVEVGGAGEGCEGVPAQRVGHAAQPRATAAPSANAHATAA